MVRTQPRSSPPTRQPTDDTVQRVLAAGLWLTVVLVVLQSLSDLANEYVLGAPRMDLNPGREGNIFTWLSVSASYAAGVGAVLHACVDSRRRVAFALLGTILLYFSVDDLVQLHERANNALRGDLPQAIDNRLDVLLFAPLFAVFLVALYRVRKVVPRAARRLLDGGAACLILSVFFDEVVGELTLRLYDRGIDWPGVVKGVFEEGLELAGVLLIATAMTAAAVLAISHRRNGATVDRVVAGGAIVAAVAFAFLVVTDLVNTFALDSRYDDLDPGVEGNVFTWLSVAAVGSAGYLALVHGVALTVRRYAYVALGVLLCVLSADDLVEAFERLARRLSLDVADPVDRRTVLLFELPLQLAVLVLAWVLSSGWPATARLAGRVGVGLLALGIFLDEALLEATDRLRDSGYADVASVKGALEEGVELAGGVLLAAALAGALIARLSREVEDEAPNEVAAVDA